VVGVSEPILQGNLEGNVVQPIVYVPYRQNPSGMFVMVRSRIPKDALTASLRNELRSIDPDLPLFDIRTLDERLWQRTWPFRVFGTLFSVFAITALVMSCVGIYAVTAYGVSQRTQEIGVRVALGASRWSVLWLVLRQAMIRIGIGLTLGLAGAIALSRVLRSVLFQVSPTDPSTFIVIAILLCIVTIAASMIPARRAMRLDPVDALRSE
jgi:ABC-type antimicrobial peptide transport system permease subunit